MSTSCKCEWGRVNVGAGMEPIILRIAAVVYCEYPGHSEEAVEDRDG